MKYRLKNILKGQNDPFSDAQKLKIALKKGYAKFKVYKSFTYNKEKDPYYILATKFKSDIRFSNVERLSGTFVMCGGFLIVLIAVYSLYIHFTFYYGFGTYSKKSD
jgi:hypothetical protein